MPVDTQQILDSADKLGTLVAQHPAVSRYQQAQEVLAKDPDAGRLLNEFNRQIMTLARQEEQGMPVTDAQRHQLETLQTQLSSHLKIKSLNIAQMEFVDLMRKVSDAIRRHIAEPASSGDGGPTQGPGPKLAV